MTSTPTATSQPDLIYSNGFESGSFSGWSSVNTDSGDLRVTSPAALKGLKGMRALIDDNRALWVADARPDREPAYRERFYFDPNSVTMTNGNSFVLFFGYSGSAPVLRVELRRSAGLYQVRASARNDGTGWTGGSWYTIGDKPHYLETYWKASTAPGADNGVLVFWVDGVRRLRLATIDNDTHRIDLVRLGAVAGLDAGTRGTIFIDAFETHRKTYIGAQTK